MAFGKKKKPEVIESLKAELKRRTSTEGQNFDAAGDGTDNLANNHFQYIEFYHVPTARAVGFKAFISNFQDNYKSDWKAESVYGRMDPIATFQRTERQISAMITCPAASIQEAEQNMRRISSMMQMLYPVYSGTGGSATIAGGPLFKVKFMNWIKSTKGSSFASISAGSAKSSGLLGYLDGLTFAPVIDSGVFQVGLDIYPQEFAFNFTLKVIHEHDMGFGALPAQGRTGFQKPGGPKNENFPYGKKLSSFNLFETAHMSKKTKKRMKELRASSENIMLGKGTK